MNTKSNWQHHFFRYRCSRVFLYFGTAPTLENVASQPRPLFSCEVRESSESQKHGQAIPLTHIHMQKWRILSVFFVWISHDFTPQAETEAEVGPRRAAAVPSPGGAATAQVPQRTMEPTLERVEAPFEASDSATAPFK